MAKLIAVFEATAKAASPGGFEDQGDELLVDLPGDQEAGRRTWYFTWPLLSKSAAEVMKALELIIAQIGLEFQCRQCSECMRTELGSSPAHRSAQGSLARGSW